MKGLPLLLPLFFCKGVGTLLAHSVGHEDEAIKANVLIQLVVAIIIDCTHHSVLLRVGVFVLLSFFSDFDLVGVVVFDSCSFFLECMLDALLEFQDYCFGPF